MSFDHCRWEYIRLNSEDDSLWKSFPENLQLLDAEKRYVDAFRAPLQGLTHMKDEQVHALRACSLVAIPPSEERTPPLEGFLKDLATMNLTGWAGLKQDVAQGMKVVPLNLSMEVYLDSMVLLQLLEATMGMGYCRICCQPTPSCLCLGAYQSVPTKTWSQMMARIPVQGVAYGLTPLDFTNWNLPLPGAPLTGGLPLPSGGLPRFSRQAAGPWAPTPPMQVPSTPQGMLLIDQQRPCQPAAPYQQAVPPMSQPAAPYQQAVPPMSQPAAPYQQASQPAAPYQQV